jgi:hypothetical protein
MCETEDKGGIEARTLLTVGVLVFVAAIGCPPNPSSLLRVISTP